MNALEFLAQRASRDPAFLGHALAIYAASEGFDDVALARDLGCTVEQLTRVRLCLRPRAEEPSFWSDVEEVASSFALDAAALANAVRRADAVIAMQRAADASRGSLLAARDRETDADEGTESETL